MQLTILALTLAASTAVGSTAEDEVLLAPTDTEGAAAATTDDASKPASPLLRVGRVAGGLLLGTAAQVAFTLGGARLGLLVDPMRPGLLYGPLGTLGSLAGAGIGSIVGAIFAVYGVGWLLFGDGALWATAVGAAAPIFVSALALLVAPGAGYVYLFAVFAAPAIGAVIGYELTSRTDRRRLNVAVVPLGEGALLAVSGTF